MVNGKVHGKTQDPSKIGRNLGWNEVAQHAVPEGEPVGDGRMEFNVKQPTSHNFMDTAKHRRVLEKPCLQQTQGVDLSR